MSLIKYTKTKKMYNILFIYKLRFKNLRRVSLLVFQPIHEKYILAGGQIFQNIYYLS